ncbi:MAG TPA: hypothetical protein VGO56_16805 [Pyrinomonadaceae bacterium]|jgi:hypothetical protein|nr:hypothetical protein [Pyrinomonadaceae bacterium]
MSKSIIGDQSWAEMTEGQKVEAVFAGHATLKQMSEGLLDGPDQLRAACSEYLAETSSSFENLPTDSGAPELDAEPQQTSSSPQLESPPRQLAKTRPPDHLKQRFGLPQGFVPRLQRYGRSVLLELNVYCLPDGREFIPCRPTGTLGARRHLYALLTNEQYLKGKRGPVYVRTDGKIFDYSVDTNMPLGEIFDTGYTIADLERTGRYAPEPRRRRKKRGPLKARSAAAAAIRG